MLLLPPFSTPEKTRTKPRFPPTTATTPLTVEITKTEGMVAVVTTRAEDDTTTPVTTTPDTLSNTQVMVPRCHHLLRILAPYSGHIQFILTDIQ